MREYFTEAIVVNKEDAGEYDSKVTFFTKELGKITAKATSLRKVVSKLNPHLQPLNLVKLRLVQKSGFQIVDALLVDNFSYSRQSYNTFCRALEVLRFINEMTWPGEEDRQLWPAIKKTLSSDFSINELLKILGFDSTFAVCGGCSAKPTAFLPQDMSFWCGKCLKEDQLSKYSLE